ncbi:MAG: hypothetical protein JWP39_2609, partial [Jatrophihabitans sp.]|nr:hypothetical protein [Jatrophihabitans sp.]
MTDIVENASEPTGWQGQLSQEAQANA